MFFFFLCNNWYIPYSLTLKEACSYFTLYSLTITGIKCLVIPKFKSKVFYFFYSLTITNLIFWCKFCDYIFLKTHRQISKKRCFEKYCHSSSPPPPSPPPILVGRAGDLKISDQNNWGGPEQKIKFGEELNLRGAYEPQWCHGCCVKRYSFMFVRF